MSIPAAANGEGLARYKLAFDAIGTSWEIETPEPLPQWLGSLVRDRIETIEMTYSRFRTDTIVYRMANAPDGGVFEFPGESDCLFDLYDRLHEITRGAVDPLVGRDLELLGYNAEYTLSPDLAAIARYRRERRNWATDVRRSGTTLIIRRPVVLDIGAAGKGLLIDIVAVMLRDAGIEDFVIDAGGDMVSHGSQLLEVGLEHPFERNIAIGVVSLEKQAICASGVNKRAWRNLHHVIDGRSGLPTLDVSATWVVSKEAMTADGLATALFFVPPGSLRHSFDFSSVRMFADGRVEIDPSLPGEVFARTATAGA